MNNRLFVLLSTICLFVSVFAIYYIFVNTALAEKYYPKARINGIDYDISEESELESTLKDLILSTLPKTFSYKYEEELYSISTEDLGVKPKKEALVNFGKGTNPQKVISEGFSILLSQGAEIDYDIDPTKILEILPYKFSKNNANHIELVDSKVKNCPTKTLNYEIDKSTLSQEIKDSLKTNQPFELNYLELIKDKNVLNLISYCESFDQLKSELLKQTQIDTDWDQIIQADLINNSLDYSIIDANLLQDLLIKKFSETYENIDKGDVFEKNGKQYILRMPKDGKELNVDQSIENFKDKLKYPDKDVQILAYNILRQTFLDNNLEQIDLTQKLGEGITSMDIYRNGLFNYRIYNSQEPLRALDNYVIEPGEVFSFHNDSGVSNGQVRTGMGVCNSTTTLFRAALHSGLEIVDRSPHTSYIQSYEYGPGYPLNIVEATYFPGPVVDLKFKNDTAFPIVLNVILYRKNDGYQYHTVEVYGSPETPKREVELTDWKTWNVKDSAHFSGSFTRLVKVNGDIIKTDTYKSYYFE